MPSQGSSFLATLGWRTQPRWGCRELRNACVAPQRSAERNYRKALGLGCQGQGHPGRLNFTLGERVGGVVGGMLQNLEFDEEGCVGADHREAGSLSASKSSSGAGYGWSSAPTELGW